MMTIVLIQSRCTIFYSYYTNFLDMAEYKLVFGLYIGGVSSLSRTEAAWELGTRVFCFMRRENDYGQVWTNDESHRHEV